MKAAQSSMILILLLVFPGCMPSALPVSNAEDTVKPETAKIQSPGAATTNQASNKHGEAKGPPKELTVDLGGGVNLELVLIPAGKFVMGSPKDLIEEELQVHASNRGYSGHLPGEGPQHQVRITMPFYLGKYPVTQEQWEAVMGNNPSDFKGAKNPVESVSWDDCQQFLDKLNARFRRPHPGPLPAGQGEFRLPSEGSGNMRAARGARRGIASGTRNRGLANMRGSKRTRTGRRIPWGRSGRTPGACTTCMETCGSGARIGMITSITSIR